MAAPPSLTTLTLPVLGMTCAACQHHVESALLSAPGVASARVDLMAHRASITFDAQLSSPQSLVKAIRAAGYDAVLSHADANGTQARSEETSHSHKTIVAITAGFFAMLLSMPLGSEMGATDHALMRVIPWVYALPHDRLRWVLLLMTAVVAAWAGRGIYLAAARALVHGATNMNTLVALGTSVAFSYSAYSTVWPADNHAVYFDAVLLIIGFLLAGKTLEERAKRRAMAALDGLSKARPATARRIPPAVQSANENNHRNAENTEIVPLEAIHRGDSLLVLPGERFPVDGLLTEGRTTVDESMLTGESTPLDRTVGEQVLAGSLNYDGAVVIRAESLGEATVLSRIAQLVQQAQSSRTPLEGLADRASAIFVPVVLCIAALTFIVWLVFAHSLPLALANSVAVLVIACPCAMGLAVPAALTVAVGRGAQLGVLFKGGEALERLTALDVLVLDKTGTLTIGRPTLIATHTFAGHTQTEVLRLAAAAEERSNHPLAHALVDAAQSQKITWRPAEQVQVLPGRGLTATVEGHPCLLGNAALLEEYGLQLPKENPPATGVTRLWMVLDNKIAACFDALDTLRPGAAEAIATLIKSGLEVRMLTGDSATAAKPIAQQAGILHVETNLDPSAKLAHIRTLQQAGLRVGMVGDGINDAAALAQADAGIALGSGADLAQEAGDVLLLRPEPTLIPAALNLAHATIRIMKQNLIWAAAYNLLGVPLAAGVLYPAFHLLLSPWLASAAMALSSVSVLANSLRLRNWSPTR